MKYDMVVILFAWIILVVCPLIGGLFFLFKGGPFREAGVALGVIFISCGLFFLWKLPASFKEEESPDVHKYFLVVGVQEFEGSYAYITYSKKNETPSPARIFYGRDASFKNHLKVRITYLTNIFGVNTATVYHLIY